MARSRLRCHSASGGGPNYKRGDIESAAEISFDCIQCGLCSSRCFGEIPQYHIAQMVRRLYGGKLVPRAKHNQDQVRFIKEGAYDFSDRESQRRVFEAQLGLASARAHPLVIHCREAVGDTLSILLAAPPDAASDLFRGEAWRTKSLQTTLAGYTLWRHAWDLSIKDGTRYFGMKHVPPGFVEPAAQAGGFDPHDGVLGRIEVVPLGDAQEVAHVPAPQPPNTQGEPADSR